MYYSTRKLLLLSSTVNKLSKSFATNTTDNFRSNAGKILTQLKSIVGSDENVSTSSTVRLQHGTDEGPYDGIAPDVVVFPTSTQMVSEIHKLCYANDVPIIPYGCGTGLEGGVNAVCGGVCVATTKMTGVAQLNAQDFDATVECGLDWRALNEYLRDTGLWFAIDPGASASIGGMAATGASGTNAVMYGTMINNVLNMEVVLPNGDIINTSGESCRSRKSSAGYNLTPLFVGSEGTLGTITKVCVKLYAIPESVGMAVCSFDTDPQAIDTVIETLQNNIPVARIEYLDDISIKACHAYSHIDLDHKPTLFIEFNGSNNEEVSNRADAVQQIAASNGGSNFKFSTDLAARNRIWKARHQLFYACLALKPQSKAVITDCCVPVSQLTQMIVKTKQLINDTALIGPMFGHVGDGNFHAIIIFKSDDNDERQRIKSAAEKMGEIALSLGGSCTGEHGIGRGKTRLLRKQFNNETIDLMRRIKSVCDPKNLMNPSKVLD